MNPTFRTKMKELLSRFLPDSPKLRYLAYLPKLKTFLGEHPENYPLFDDRYQMYDYINTSVIEERALMFCEFGVFEGDSIRHWTNANKHTDSRFFGFDTFTGLPQPWEQFTAGIEKNAFDVGGEFPRIDDTRVCFIKGMFQDTLLEFLAGYDSKQPLIIHNDSDLYSSTLYVLSASDRIIVPGTIIIFDEFSAILHEFRALEDYCASYGRKFELIAATKSPTKYYSQVAIRML